MQSDATRQSEQPCLWCGGTIQENAQACSGCGAARPREDLVAPGYAQVSEPATSMQSPDAIPGEFQDDETRARQILKDLDAYVPEEAAAPVRSSRDSSDDMMIVIGGLIASGVIGGILGWFAGPPLVHSVFNEMIGIETDGPEAFRRLGAFLGALIAMFFGSMLIVFMRR